MSWGGLRRSSYCSEDSAHCCDGEDRVRRIFEACDTNRDGFIDKNDLRKVCADLNLVGDIDFLMRELGADENGKISYEQFLKTEIALNSLSQPGYCKHHSHRRSHSCVSSCSAKSTGKCDHWEFDSGARDLQSEQALNCLGGSSGLSGGGGSGTCNAESLLNLANKLHSAALASLQSEISELSERLHDVTEERDVLENCLKQAKERNATSCTGVLERDMKKLELENKSQRDHIHRLSGDLEQTKQFLNVAYDHIDVLEHKLRDYEEQVHSATKSPKKSSKCLSPNCISYEELTPVLKVAERVKLQKVDKNVTGKDLSNTGVVHTEIAEHLVSKVQDDCNAQEMCRQERRQIELQTEKARIKQDHLRSQNVMLQASYEEMKDNCERLYLLLGKYESSAVSLKLVCETCDDLISNYEELIHVLMNNRRRDALVSKEEKDLRAAIGMLKKQKSKIQPSSVELESYHDIILDRKTKPSSPERKILDLETAVLMQDLTEIRKENVKLKMTILQMSQEIANLDSKVLELQNELETRKSAQHDQMNTLLDRIHFQGGTVIHKEMLGWRE